MKQVWSDGTDGREMGAYWEDDTDDMEISIDIEVADVYLPDVVHGYLVAAGFVDISADRLEDLSHQLAAAELFMSGASPRTNCYTCPRCGRRLMFVTNKRGTSMCGTCGPVPAR